jgi:4-amino-4-deoxy-L-arabinose transferase-like glycosyltransferase
VFLGRATFRLVPPRSLLAVVAVLGFLLTVTVVTGPFTIDENNYLVTVTGLRQGSLTVPGTDQLPPSRELLFFDPAAPARKVLSKVVSVAPPLYAPLALPFSILGWRGLVAMNTLAFLASILIVFQYARRHTAHPEAGWVAAAALGVGAYFVEYAQGVWPHMVTVALAAAATLLAGQAIETGSIRFAAAAGFSIALASGVRYQNAFFLACLGIGLVLLGQRRLRIGMAFGIGALVPLGISSVLNATRFGSWNPISKGPGYLVSTARLAAGEGSFLDKVATMAWARLVDYSSAPSLSGTVNESFHTPHPVSGAYVMVTAVKKAWLQSSPWLIVPLVILVIAWLPAVYFKRVAGQAPQRQLRLLSLVVIPTLAMFSASGLSRTDGLCFNQRYFCELVPLMAVAFAWSLPSLASRRTAVFAGFLAGAALVVGALRPHHLLALRHYMVMYVPLLLAALLAVAWGAEVSARGSVTSTSRRGLVATTTLAILVGATLGWAMAVHLGDDLQASRILRRSRQDYLRQLRPYLADHSAVFASGGIKDALGPVQLDLDVVIAVPALDRAMTAKELLDAFLAEGRRVFVLPNVLPADLLDEMLAGKKVRYLGMPRLLIEVAEP